MAAEPIECQVLVLRVSIHCEGCKKKVKKVLQNINGVYRCEIDARSNRVAVTASAKLDPYVLVAKLRKSGKQADLWPEQPPPPPQPQQQAPAESQEPKNQAEEPSKPNEPAENAEAVPAEPSNLQPSPPEPKQSTGEAPSQGQESSKESAGGEAATPAPAQQQPAAEAKGKATQPQHHPAEMMEKEKQPVDARVTMVYDRGLGGGYATSGMPPAAPMVMSYNQARPTVSASYYAPAPAPAPMPMPMPMPAERERQAPGPSRGYIDEHYTPSYYSYNNNYNYSRPSSTYEPYYYEPPQPSPYSYQYQQPAPSEDYYYYNSAPPQRSAFSPPRERDGYGDMFNDENANSCTVM